MHMGQEARIVRCRWYSAGVAWVVIPIGGGHAYLTFDFLPDAQVGGDHKLRLRLMRIELTVPPSQAASVAKGMVTLYGKPSDATMALVGRARGSHWANSTSRIATNRACLSDSQPICTVFEHIALTDRHRQ